MLNRWTSVALFGVVWGLSPSVDAAETPLSYVADNQCFCNLSASSSLHDRVVATPVGGQSVAQVCERIGSGPALIQRDGQYNFPVYDDMQCGHGPGFTGFIGLLNDAGTDLKDAPKWDLAAAYVASTESKEPIVESKQALAESTESLSKESLVESKTASVESVESISSTTPVATTTGERVIEAEKPDSLDVASTQPTATRRFKPRYIQVPVATEQTPVATAPAAAPETSALEIAEATPAVAVADKAPERSVENIEHLSLATTEPVEAAAVQDTTAAKVTKITSTNAPAVTQKITPIVTPIAVPKITQQAPAVEVAPLNEVASAVVEEPIVAVKEPVTKETLPKDKEIQEVAENINTAPIGSTILVSASNALRLPTSVRASSQEFSYVSLMPVNYDFGGTGARFTGSFAPGNKLRFMLKAAAAADYREASVGASYIITPRQADRLTFALTAGVEYGRFSLDAQNIETTVDDTGVFTQFNSRFVLNNRFELQGGVGFSSFFDGDPHAFGAALYHLTRTLDLSGEFEVGDNDSVGLGLRYYY